MSGYLRRTDAHLPGCKSELHDFDYSMHVQTIPLLHAIVVDQVKHMEEDCTSEWLGTF